MAARVLDVVERGGELADGLDRRVVDAVGAPVLGCWPVIGPVGNFAPLPDAAKWLLSFAMLLGRLELFTILVVLTPWFWRS